MTALPLVSVMVTTRNRVALLSRALGSVFGQDYPRVEVLVVDDASSDDTSTYIRSNHPSVRLFRFEENRGLIAARNLMLKEAKGEYIISLDDDAYFINANAISNVIERMGREPEIGVATFRLRKFRTGESSEDPREYYTNIFNGWGNCLRKAILDEIGLYREFFFRQGEELDLAVRLLDRGHRILFFPGAVVAHEWSPIGRDSSVIPSYTVRNQLLCFWINEPFSWCVLSTGYWIGRWLADGWRRGSPRYVFRGLYEAVREIPRVISLRRPISSKTMWIYLALRRSRISDRSAIRRLYDHPPRSLAMLFRRENAGRRS